MRHSTFSAIIALIAMSGFVCLQSGRLCAQDMEISLPGNSESQRFIVKNKAGLPLLMLEANGRAGFGAPPSDDATLNVDGRIRITGGSPGAGKVLTSDPYGSATWETPSSGGGLTLPYSGGCTSGNAFDVTSSDAAAIVARATNSSGSTARAIEASSASPNAATVFARNTSSNPAAVVLGLGDGSSNVFTVNRRGNVVANGTVTADAFTATSSLGGTAQPAAGTLYQDNIIYAWGVISALGNIVNDFGISSVTRNSGNYTITFDRTLNGPYAILVSGVGGAAAMEVVSQTANSCVVRHWADVGPWYFYILVVGRP